MKDGAGEEALAIRQQAGLGVLRALSAAQALDRAASAGTDLMNVPRPGASPGRGRHAHLTKGNTVRRLILAAIGGTAAAVALLGGTLPAGAAVHGPAAGGGYTLVIGQSSGDGEMNWNTNTNHPDLLTRIGTVSASATADIEGITAHSEMPTTAPVFNVASGYGAGTPRLEIQAGDGSYEAGYPASVCGAVAPAVCWASPLGTQGTSYDATYGQVRGYIDSHGGVVAAFVVADGSQATPYTADISNLSWDTTQLIPGTIANQLGAKDVCGNYANRHWTVTSEAGTGVTFYAATRLNSGHWRKLGHPLTVAAIGSVNFTTTRGTTLRLGYANGLGQWVYGEFLSDVTSC